MVGTGRSLTAAMLLNDLQFESKLVAIARSVLWRIRAKPTTRTNSTLSWARRRKLHGDCLGAGALHHLALATSGIAAH